MENQYFKDLIKLVTLLLLLTSPLFLLITGFDYYYDYSKSIMDGKLDLIPVKLAEKNHKISCTSFDQPYEIDGMALIKNNIFPYTHTSGFAEHLHSILKQKHLTAKAKFSFEEILHHSFCNVEDRLAVGALELTIPSGHFKINTFQMNICIILEVLGNQIRCKLDTYSTNLDVLVECNVDYDLSQNVLNSLKLSVYDLSTSEARSDIYAFSKNPYTMPILDIDYKDDDYVTKPSLLPIWLLFICIFTSICLYSPNQVSKLGEEYMCNIKIEDKQTAFLVAYSILSELKDLLILHYFLKQHDSNLLYILFVAICFLIWIEIINASLILQSYLEKVLKQIENKNGSEYLTYLIYAWVILLHAPLGYNFDFLYYCSICLSNIHWLYVHNIVWIPYILANMYYKKRGQFDTLACVTISFRTCITMNYFTISYDTSSSVYTIISRWFYMIVIHTFLIWFVQMQRKHGSRFMLPGSMRSLKYDYSRQLHHEFSLKELKNHDLPHCDYCMIEIYKPGWYDERLEYREYDMVREMPNLYAVTPCGHVFHYACLRESLERRTICPKCTVNIPRMDEYDD